MAALPPPSRPGASGVRWAAHIRQLHPPATRASVQSVSRHSKLQASLNIQQETETIGERARRATARFDALVRAVLHSRSRAGGNVVNQLHQQNEKLEKADDTAKRIVEESRAADGVLKRMRDRLFREKCALYGLATVTLARHRPAPLSLVTRARGWVARGSRAPYGPAGSARARRLSRILLLGRAAVWDRRGGLGHQKCARSNCVVCVRARRGRGRRRRARRGVTCGVADRRLSSRA